MNNYRSNNRKHRFKSNSDRNFRKRPINPHKNQNEFNSNIDFRHRNPGRNNQNAAKLIDKYNNLAREALSSGDKILSENYLQHADHFSRVLNIQEINKINFVNIDIDKIQFNKYDFVISNPPYINKFDLSRLDESVKIFEPYIAFEAGIDGLREITNLIIKSKKLLKNNGKLIFEIGQGQSLITKKILNQNGYFINKVIKDISSIPRVVVSTKVI